jgi:RNA recognition motif-containing protein
MSTNQVIQKTTLFVGDLSIFCTENDLIEAFTPFGTVVEVKIMRCEETNKNLCYGFVKFANAASSIQAMQEMNGRLLSGRPLRFVYYSINSININTLRRISWASHRLKKGSFGTCSVSDAHGNNSSSLHIHYSATQVI